MHRTDRNSLSNPRLRVLEAVHHLGGEHVTINQLATHLGGHPNASRAHLTALARDGFIKIADIPREGPGRRPRGHTLTDAGRRVIDPVEHAGPSLTNTFASYLVQTGHGKTVSSPAAANASASTRSEHRIAVTSRRFQGEGRI